ncbi:hypothetical protein ACK323_03660 [Aeromonas enteropelogenes]|uniref:hypothetical protein n=1 Tax=Aeromonas enteropelogenes TaxID=29489 RepID=UPI00398A0FFF
MLPFGTSASASYGGTAINNSGPGDVNVTLGNPSQLTSVLTPLLIKVIETHKPEYNATTVSIRDPGVDEKIAFNKVRLYSDSIQECCGLMVIIEQALNFIDNESPSSKATFLWAINKKYKDVKMEMLLEAAIFDPSDVAEFIKSNADMIIKKVSDRIFLDAGSCIGHHKEHIQAAQELVVCYGFINCQILEAPQ